jgi:LPS export ABC transporter protein LptC
MKYLLNYLKKAYIIIIFLCLSIVFFFVFIKSTLEEEIFNKTLKSEVDDSLKYNPDITINNLELCEIKNDKKIKVHIHSKKNNLYKKINLMICKDITCTILENNKQIGYLIAENSQLNKMDKTLYFTDKVKGTLFDITFRGNNFFYDHAKQLFSSKTPIFCSNKQFSLSANKSFFSIKDKELTLEGGVSSEFFIKPCSQQPLK